ncbi:MAG: gamma carbonic anhydrase family protein [Candidatus Hermodarchaeota archaeon]
MPIIIPSPKTGKEPQVHNLAYIAPTAVIIGDVTIDEGSNIWFGAVIRGDWGPIKIGKNTSIQENVTIHIEQGKSVIIGDNCVIGHHCMIHGPAEIGDNCTIGIGSNVLHNSKLGKGCMVGAGAVLLNKEIPDFSLVVGIPANIKKKLHESEKTPAEITSKQYVENGKLYKEFFEKNPKLSKI